MRVQASTNQNCADQINYKQYKPNCYKQYKLLSGSKSQFHDNIFIFEMFTRYVLYAENVFSSLIFIYFV